MKKRSVKSNKETDVNIRAIEEGQQASIVLAFLADNILVVEGEILEALIIRYRQGLLTSDQARDKVAEIAGLRRLIDHLETISTRGIQAKREEIKNG